jgi:Fe-S-cluster containining protein
MRFEPHCRSCKNATHCCVFPKDRGFTFVGVQDAKRIKDATGKEYAEFLEFSSLPKKLVQELKSEDPLLEGGLRYKQLDKKNRILRLKKKKNGECIFLTKGRRCGIYSVRPNICRMYPFWGVRLLDGTVKIVGHDEPATCPAVRSKESLTAQQTKELKSVFQRIEKETKSYRKNIRHFI